MIKSLMCTWCKTTMFLFHQPCPSPNAHSMNACFTVLINFQKSSKASLKQHSRYCRHVSDVKIDCQYSAQVLHEVMDLLRRVSVTVVAISVDNASTNQKFYTHCLCNGTLRTNIIDSETGQPIYLIFDPVHDLKNVYNNSQGRNYLNVRRW
jgi:peroxiredoxin